MHRLLVPLSFAFALAVSSGCQLYQPPETGPGEEVVFEAARQVIAERYPNATPVRKSNLVLALTPVEMDGGHKSRKQITVQVHRNYLGAWEPKVRVVKHIEVGEPPLEADPEAETPRGAGITAQHDWQPLVHLPIEANGLRQAILEAVGSVS